jgi:hypothetical protein
MFLKESLVEKYFAGRSVIILGSAPCVLELSDRELSQYDVIVRVNNYEIFNACRRVDVYYSFFGRSIRGVDEKVRRDNPKFLFFKYPFDFAFNRHTKGKKIAGKSGDFRFVQRLRKDLLANVRHFAQTPANFISNFCAIGSMPTTGVAAILDIIRYQPKELAIAGFDFFKSKKHNINEQWNPRDGDGHDFETEEIVVSDLIANNLLKNLTGENKCVNL